MNSSNYLNVASATVNYPQLQRRLLCNCRTDAILKVVTEDTAKKGRLFWCCRKYPNGDCRYLRWYEVENNESSSTTQNRFSRPEASNGDNYSYNNSNTNRNNNSSSEVNSHHNQNSEYTTARNFSERSSLPSPTRSPSPTRLLFPTRSPSPTATITTTNDTVTNDMFARDPNGHENWNSVPKYSTSQFLDVVHNHVVRKDKEYEKSLKKTRKEMEKLKKENEFFGRENDILKAEKRLLEVEISQLRNESKRRR